MSDVLIKLRRLIALSASDNENEARNAAYLACKMIREHKLTFSGEAPTSDYRRPAAEAQARAASKSKVNIPDPFETIFGRKGPFGGGIPAGMSPEEVMDFMDEMFGTKARERAQREQASRPPESSSRESPFSAWARDRGGSSAPSPNDGYPQTERATVIITKFDCRCRVCGRFHHAGGRVIWKRHEGVACADRPECRVGVFAM